MSITRTAGSAPAGNRAEPEGRDDGRLAGILARWIVATLARDGFGRRADLREDCLLEAEVAVWRAETHDPPLDEAAILRYAFRVTARAVRRLLRDEAEWRERGCPADVEAAEAGGVPDERGCFLARAPSGCAHLEERLVNRLWLDRMLEQLPHRDRELLELAYLGEWSDAEIAARLGLFPEAVRMRRRRALDRLRSLLAPPRRQSGGG